MSRALSRLSLYICRALFMYGLKPLRMGSTIVLAAHLALVYTLLRSPQLMALPTAVLVTVYALCGMTRALAYAYGLASIPGAWMAVTQIFIDMQRGLWRPWLYTSIFLRASLGALHALYAIQTINVIELSYLLFKVSRTGALMPLLVARGGVVLKELTEMLAVHGLKGEPVWKSLAIAMLRSDEMAGLMEEGLWCKRFRFVPRPMYSVKGLAMQISIVVSDVVSLVLFGWIH